MALGSTQPPKEMAPGIFRGLKGGRCVELTTLPPSCADCLEIWDPQPPVTLKACPVCNGIALRFTLLLLLLSSSSSSSSKVLYFPLKDFHVSAV
jgi:hypothetical protein